MKLRVKHGLRCSPSPQAGFTAVRFPYDAVAIDWLKSMPGPSARRDDNGWTWHVPDELIGGLSSVLGVDAPANGRSIAGHLLPREQARYRGLQWQSYSTAPTNSTMQVTEYNPKLRPYQHQAIVHLLAAKRMLLSFEMRLGKSAVAIEACRLADARAALICCPASTRLVWADELAKWWPDSPEVGIIWSVKDVEALRLRPQRSITIVSYELLESAIDMEEWNAIIIDESHMMGNAAGTWRRKTKRAEQVTELLHDNPQALQLLLTGTPLTTENLGVLWHQLNALYPMRFGNEYRFRLRYQNRIPDKWAHSGYRFDGVHPDHATELQSRLDAISMRVTRQAVASYLPPSEVRLVKLRVKDMPRAKKLGVFDGMRAHLNDASAFLLASGRAKIDVAVEHVLEVGTQIDCAAAIVYHHDLAQELITALEAKGDRPVVYVSGEQPVKVRMAELNRARELGRCYIVGTMMSINTGLNLTWVQHATIVELYTAPGPLAQIVARFAAVDSAPSTPVDILVLEGTSDESEARRVTDRLDDIGSIVARGGTETAIRTALAPVEQSDESFFQAIRDIASRRVSE